MIPNFRLTFEGLSRYVIKIANTAVIKKGFLVTSIAALPLDILIVTRETIVLDIGKRIVVYGI